MAMRYQSKPAPPRPDDFVCDDCGGRRRGRWRMRCTRCQRAVCHWCEKRHARQHANEMHWFEVLCVDDPVVSA